MVFQGFSHILSPLLSLHSSISCLGQKYQMTNFLKMHCIWMALLHFVFSVLAAAGGAPSSSAQPADQTSGSENVSVSKWRKYLSEWENIWVIGGVMRILVRTSVVCEDIAAPQGYWSIKIWQVPIQIIQHRWIFHNILWKWQWKMADFCDYFYI